MKKILVVMLSFCLLAGVKADEGMWMLPLIEKLNIQTMKGMGLTLTAEEIYSDKQASLKDAVVIFGGGCTGVIVSDKGLVFTNHHCGYDVIQQHSALAHNYLKDGFTATRLEDEIPSPGLSVKFLVRIENVTEKVKSQLHDSLKGDARADKLENITKTMEKEAEKDTDYTAKLKPFYSGNEFYLFVYQEYKDVRFAYAPPTAIGKFGGDTDNWMWPRHTGDFAVFRVYSSPDGSPAEYSKDNVPFSPKRFAVISSKGYQPDDFTMIMGNPGSTVRYLSSWGVSHRMKATNQALIDVRGAKQDVWRSFMRADEAINIAYASKYARSSNYWKNSIGMNKAIAKLGIIAEKQKQEKEFAGWVNADPARRERYKDVLKTLEEGYSTIYPYSRAITYLRESLYSGVEMPRIAMQVVDMMKDGMPTDTILLKAQKLYKDFSPVVDQAALSAMLDIYKKSVDADALTAVYPFIQKKFKGDYARYAKYMFDKSAFASHEKLTRALKGKKPDFSRDPAIVFAGDVQKTNSLIRKDEYRKTVDKLIDTERMHLEGIMAMAAEKGEAIYPDANSTMRLTYGRVGGYLPADAAEFRYYTTTKGILEKEIPGDAEFDVPALLKKAIQEKNFGNYVDTRTGQMHVAFLSNNDITGGNSGSPIFNAAGELIGLAFDGNWEAMSGDIVFEPDLQRTINVDIRYVLFVMDKVGGAQRLIDELQVK